MSNVFSEAFRTELQDIVTTSVKSALAQTSEKQQTASLDKLLDANAVSNYLGLTKPTIDKLVQEGKLKPIEIGERTKRFRLSEIEAFLESNRRAS